MSLESTATKNQARIPRANGSVNGISDAGTGNSTGEYGK